MKKVYFIVFCLFFIKIQGFSQVISDCRVLPTYVNGLGFDLKNAAFSTSEQKKRGLCFVELGTGKVYQHKSWSSAGTLGPMLITETSDIFVAPIPAVNIYYNKPSEQNYLYKIDQKTQEMTKVAALPALANPTPENSFGLMGLAYDCDTKVIYASSLAGSTREKENGRIFAINKLTYQIIDTLNNTDCLGLGVAYIQGEKRLLLGKARNGMVVSIAVKADGSFGETYRKEINLDGLGPRGDDIARKIRFGADGILQIQGVEFYFNLIAPTEKQESKYYFKHNGQKWGLVKME